MGIVSLLYNALSNTIAWILRFFWTKKTSQRRVQETDKDDKRDKSATKPVLVDWLSEKARYMSMPRSERRQFYSCGDNYVALSDVQEWSDYFAENQEWLKKLATGRLEDVCSINPELNKKVSIWRGDITMLEVDVIVNAANKRLLGGGGVDGAIHSAAGKMLREECATLKGCETGEAKVTGGYLLPAKYVIHTVGPVGSRDKELASCYQNSLNIMKQLKQRTLAIPCISVGIYAFPNEEAANIALSTVRKFLEENKDHVDRIIFCLFMSSDVEVYEVLMQKYFPVCPPDVTPATPSATDITEHKHETPPINSEGIINKEMSPEAVTVKQASKEEVDVQTLAKNGDHDDLREPSSPKNQEHSEISKADAKEPVAKNTKDKLEISKPSEECTKSDEIHPDLVATKPEPEEKAQVELQALGPKPVGENLKEPSPPQSQEHSENGQADARKPGADVVMQHEEKALETSQKSDDSTRLHQNLSELPTSVTETEPPNMKSEPNVELPKNAVTEKKESDPKVETPAMTVTEPQADFPPVQMNTTSDPDSIKSVEPKMEPEQGSSSSKVGTSDTVTIGKQRSDGDEEGKHVQEGSNQKSVEAELTSTKTELDQMAESGADKEIDTSMAEKEDENHSLMSDATDFEHISLSEASNKITETNSSEEQQIKLDKNENMSHDAMVEGNNEHDQKSASKI